MPFCNDNNNNNKTTTTLLYKTAVFVAFTRVSHQLAIKLFVRHITFAMRATFTRSSTSILADCLLILECCLCLPLLRLLTKIIGKAVRVRVNNQR
jgi:hypothetical protein